MKNCSSVRKIRHTPMKRIVTPTPRKRQNFLFWQNKNPFGILVINLRQPQNYRFLVQIIPFFSFVSFSSRFSSVTYCPQFGDFLHFCLAWECLSVSWKFSCDKSHDNFWFKKVKVRITLYPQWLKITRRFSLQHYVFWSVENRKDGVYVFSSYWYRIVARFLIHQWAPHQIVLMMNAFMLLHFFYFYVRI